MSNINIDYEDAIDFGHCDEINDAGAKLSELTNLLNKYISIRHRAKQDILNLCSNHPGERMHKLSWDNKLIALMSVDESSHSIVDLYQEADEAYIKIKNKQSQVIDDIMRLKKIMEVTPR